MALFHWFTERIRITRHSLARSPCKNLQNITIRMQRRTPTFPLVCHTCLLVHVLHII
ncbi:hypothetical protein YPPY42_3403 [Yersinia pestis PY-42]|nr:type VI secretion protein, EvpB/family [Yersinia pestis PY-02]EIR88333.1 hypothetical protein YPPY42_3403 [Yersinia pestis PY-42]EIT24787.1 hypothetical protein YPPY95_3380 [Yersinia pestis PY-95]